MSWSGTAWGGMWRADGRECATPTTRGKIEVSRPSRLRIPRVAAAGPISMIQEDIITDITCVIAFDIMVWIVLAAAEAPSCTCSAVWSYAFIPVHTWSAVFMLTTFAPVDAMHAPQSRISHLMHPLATIHSFDPSSCMSRAPLQLAWLRPGGLTTSFCCRALAYVPA
jgi:hypothetical protein